MQCDDDDDDCEKDEDEDDDEDDTEDVDVQALDIHSGASLSIVRCQQSDVQLLRLQACVSILTSTHFFR